MALSSMKDLIGINDLKAGMTIASDVIIDDTIVVAKGVIVTEKIINKLRQVSLQNSVSVYSHAEFDEDVDNLINNEENELKEVQMKVKKLSEGMENMFNKFESTGKTDINEVRIFSEKIIKDITSPRAIIKNILLKGSGQDCIFRHSVNVATLSLLLAQWLGIEKSKQNLLLYTAILHDFGKIKIDKSILNKKSKLTTEEIKKIKTHPIVAYNLIRNIPYLSDSIAHGVLMHHERLDGSGYPLGLKSERIHNFAKIIAIVDTFDAVNSERAYRQSRDPFKALQIIKNESLGRLDYEYSKIFIDHIINYYIGEYVILNDNKKYKIVYIDPNNLCKPLLLLDGNFVDLKKNSKLEIKCLAM